MKKMDNPDELFIELQMRVRDEGLLDKSPIRGSVEIVIVLLLLSISLYSINHFSPIVIIILFVLTMIRSTFVAHDLIHGQYYSRKTNRRLAYIFANGIIGISVLWWENKHNILHHSFTNIIGKDTDIEVAGGAFMGKKLYSDFFHKHQHFLFWISIPLVFFKFWLASLMYNLKNKHALELVFMGLNLIIPMYIFIVHGVVIGLIITLSIVLIWSIWFGAVIIVNHLGLETYSVEQSRTMTWIELQTSTSRNIKGNWVTHWLYGGLNTQIEHHLFPKAPRFYLLTVAKITENFCIENSIPYKIVTPMQSYIEIFKYLKKEKL